MAPAQKNRCKNLPKLINTCGPSAEGRRYVATRNMKTNPKANPKAQSGSCTTPMQQREIRASVTPTNCVLYYKWYNMSFVGDGMHTIKHMFLEIL